MEAGVLVSMQLQAAVSIDGDRYMGCSEGQLVTVPSELWPCFYVINIITILRHLGLLDLVLSCWELQFSVDHGDKRKRFGNHTSYKHELFDSGMYHLNVNPGTMCGK